MSEPPPDRLETARATAQAAVDHLVSIAAGEESNEWLAQNLAVQRELASGRLREALREHSRLVDYRIQPKWVASREIQTIINDAMNNLARELKLPNAGEKPVHLDDFPQSITAWGTIAEEETRSRNAFANAFRDPWDDDPRYREIVAAADALANATLEHHPMQGGLGFCHVFWETKKEILKQTYGLDWQTPAERMPNTIFD